MKIEIASELDIEQLVNIINLCYRGKESLKGWTSEAEIIEGTRATPDSLRKQMSEPGLNIFKCTDDTGKIVASSMAHHQGDEMHTGLLCVLPHMQAQGLGRKMVNAVEDLARKLQCSSMKIEVVSSRAELIGWYERLGFKSNGKVTKFPEPAIEYGFPKYPIVLMEMRKLLI